MIPLLVTRIANLLLLIVLVTAAMESYGTAFNWQV